MKKTALVATVGIIALATWSITDLFEPDSNPCVTSATVSATIDSSNDISVDVESGSTTLCSDLDEGETCTLYTGSQVALSFATSSDKFMFIEASSNVLSSPPADDTLKSGNALHFVVVGASGSDAFFEGDPVIQVETGSCN